MRTFAWHVVSTREKLVTTRIMTPGWELLYPVRTRVPTVPPGMAVSRLDERRAGQPLSALGGLLWEPVGRGPWVETVQEPLRIW